MLARTVTRVVAQKGTRSMGGGGIPRGNAIPLKGGNQEMPPPGGFPTVRHERKLPGTRLLTGPQIWGLATLAKAAKLEAIACLVEPHRSSKY